MILDTARSVMTSGRVGDAVQFRLSKQAAFMGKVSFPPEEEPLGSLHVQITGGERVIDWLAPRTEGGVPVEEIDLEEVDLEEVTMFSFSSSALVDRPFDWAYQLRGSGIHRLGDSGGGPAEADPGQHSRGQADRRDY